ncbi:ciliated left-right organizer metallopeptidase [Periophthalmus magnuspinnatus]|uniref:ciliated left-right organizer metallopeptidase n=1 Tax=Periophthalmus magnuspinnatus TaxID=409849 RepID=UPI00243719CD|nr:ciliated left-right organizer metallopeptidase [Periophthalmus magnuspinnatus]
MTAVLDDPSVVRIDPMTLAALQDTGWYTADQNRAQCLVWGQGKGNRFGSPSTCKNNSAFFCSGNGFGCHYLHLHKGQCQSDPYLDGCRIYKPILNGSECWLTGNAQQATQDEMFGHDSRCFFSTLNKQIKGYKGFIWCPDKRLCVPDIAPAEFLSYNTSKSERVVWPFWRTSALVIVVSAFSLVLVVTISCRFLSCCKIVGPHLHLE